MSDVIKTIGRQIGNARTAAAQGRAEEAHSAAQAALEQINKIELNYENLDWRQLAEGDAHSLLGNMPAAEKAYRQAMIAAPNQSGGYLRLAELLQQNGRDEDLVKHVTVALRKFPQNPFFLKIHAIKAAANSNYDEAIPALAKAYQADDSDHATADALGICLQNINQFNEAALYQARAFELQPTNPMYALRFGMAMAGAGMHESAIELYKIAINLDAHLSEAYSQLGYELQKQGQPDDALKAYQDGLAQNPNSGSLNFNFGRLLQEKSQTTEAIPYYKKAITAGGPEADSAAFFVASLEGPDAAGQSPAAPPPEFVRGLFDFYANDFENSLLNNLHYQAPGQLQKLLTSDAARAVLDITKTKADIVDLGCGTGLCGVLLKDYAANLVGVDMSANMIRRAREKGIYSDFKKENVVTFLETAPAGSYNLAVAGDVLIYVGELTAFFTGLARTLASPSLVALSVEKLAETAGPAGFKLLPTARYAHKESYLRDLAMQHGFTVAATGYAPIRQHRGQDIDGIYVLLSK